MEWSTVALYILILLDQIHITLSKLAHMIFYILFVTSVLSKLSCCTVLKKNVLGSDTVPKRPMEKVLGLGNLYCSAVLEIVLQLLAVPGCGFRRGLPKLIRLLLPTFLGAFEKTAAVQRTIIPQPELVLINRLRKVERLSWSKLLYMSILIEVYMRRSSKSAGLRTWGLQIQKPAC